jgi:hypothetical protein
MLKIGSVHIRPIVHEAISRVYIGLQSIVSKLIQVAKYY